MPRILLGDEQQIWKLDGKVPRFSEAGDDDVRIDWRSLKRVGGVEYHSLGAVLHSVKLIFGRVMAAEGGRGLEKSKVSLLLHLEANMRTRTEDIDSSTQGDNSSRDRNCLGIHPRELETYCLPWRTNDSRPSSAQVA